MKVSSINPVLIATDIEKEKAGFEAEGFTQRHHLDEGNGIEIYVMETENGSRIDLVVLPGAKPGSVGIRMNVDNLEEAIAAHKAIGFVGGDKIFETKSNKITEMTRENTDVNFILVEHKK